MTKRTKIVIFQGGSTLAFTEYETEQLRKALLKETWHTFVSLLRNITLSQNEGSLITTTVHILILTVSHKEQLGELYPQVPETLLHGTCKELFE